MIFVPFLIVMLLRKNSGSDSVPFYKKSLRQKNFCVFFYKIIQTKNFLCLFFGREHMEKIPDLFFLLRQT